MAAEIRVYFEGHARLKPGFHAFFRELRKQALEKRCRFELISCGSGEKARQDFKIALQTNRDAWPILLRDSEGPLPRSPASRRGERVFWMVEMMEAWFLADQAALVQFYGAGFQRSALKANPKVEQISKEDLQKRLAKATRNSQKGNYFDNKTSHGPKLLALIDPALVRQAAPNCERLFHAILAHLN